MKYFLSILTCISLCISLTFGQDITVSETPLPLHLVFVDVTTQWNNTGITVQVGDTIMIICEGIASTTGGGGTDPARLYWIGPEGFGDNITDNTYPVSGASAYSVIGKIGNGGTAFYVGKNRVFRSNVSGQLYLGYNDKVFWDNIGAYVAYVGQVRSGNWIVSAAEPNSTLPSRDRLDQNYPNPFNPSTTIQFVLPQRQMIAINIYDEAGQLVKSLLNEERSAGTYTIAWDGTTSLGAPVSSGTYFYTIRTDNLLQTKKMLLLK